MNIGEVGRLRDLLRSVRRRLRAVWLLDTVQRLAPAVAVVALVLVAAGWVLPWAWTDWAALGLAAALLLAVTGVAVAVRLPDTVVARAADRGLATRDAFATALEFPADVEHFGSRIRERAVRLADGARPRDAVPVRWRRRSLLIVAAIVPAVVALALVTNPQDGQRAQRAREAAAVDDVADELATSAERLRADAAGLDAATRLDELAAQLRRSDDPAEAEALARRAADELAREQTPEALATKAATQGLDRSLANEPLPGASAGQDAASQLGAMSAGLPGLDGTQLAAAADRMDDLAVTQQVGDPTAAAALALAADAMRAGDIATAQAALGDAATADAAATATAAATAALGEAAAAARAAADRLADGGRPGQGQGQSQGQGNSQDPSDGRGQGQGEGQGEGQGGGQGQGQGDGQGGGGGGGSGSPDGDVSGGGASSGNQSQGGQGGQGQGTGSSGGRAGEEPDLDTVFDPARGTPGDELTVGGGEGSGEGGPIGRTDGPTNAGTSRVPLADAITDYRRQATETMDRFPVAPSDRDLVRDYFDHLQGRD